MAIVTEVQFHDFWNWLNTSDQYKTSFSYDAAQAVFNYMEELSDDIGEPIEFDPIAWICDFTEYQDLDDLKEVYSDNEIESIDDLAEYTQIISQQPLVIQDF